MADRLAQLQKAALALPLLPGVYIMKDKTEKIIYIGKAKMLKNRVSQYFRPGENHPPKVARMVSNVDHFEYIVTASEFEALVLECNLIKEYRPKYNILLKDDKGYSYIAIGGGEWKTLEAVKQKTDPNATYLGPYTSSFSVKNAVEEAKRVFRLPTCGKQFPQCVGKSRPCLNYHIKQCFAPCRGKVTREEYNAAVDQAIAYIKGGNEETIRRLTELMEFHAERMEFEKAAEARDKIAAIRKIADQQNVILDKDLDIDVVAVRCGAERSCVELIKYRGGRLTDKSEQFFTECSGEDELRTAFVQGYYTLCNDLPRRLYLDGPVEDMPLLEEYLAQRAGRRVAVSIPERGEPKRLVELASANAAEKLSRGTGLSGKEVASLDELRKVLGLPAVPGYIEAYDISNIGSDTIVGGMVVFENGRPLRKAYRRFEIKDFAAPDDYAAMRQMLERRIDRYFAEKDSGEGFGRLPDLILLDGGEGHVRAILPLLAQKEFSVPTFGMVKDSHHKTRAIAADGGEISLKSNRAGYSLIYTIQEEVHRYSIAYSRSRHRKTGLTSQLTQIEGIGPKRTAALLSHFKTMKALREASVEQIAAVKGMSRPMAERVYRALREES
ncbi:MAG: excinuclease ABC subunit UvrC [Oscillospiraceae bacterium]|nr:excinuclease ABC subunit UvrC [Oscillospiraceae bacterium]